MRDINNPLEDLQRGSRLMFVSIALLVCTSLFGIILLFLSLSEEIASFAGGFPLGILIIFFACGCAIFLLVNAFRTKKVIEVLAHHHGEIIALQEKQGQALKEFRHIFNQSNDLLLIIDSNGSITDVNATAAAYFQYEADALLKLNITALDQQFTHQGWKEFWQHLKKDSKYPLETNFIRKDKSSFHVEAIYHYAELEGKEICFCLAKNVTALKEAQNELLTAKDKISRLNLKLHKHMEREGKMLLKAQSNKAMKNELFTTVGSDIKTSLKGMMNMVDYLYKTAFGDTQQVFSQNAHSSAFSLLMTVNNILDATRAEEGDMILDRVSFKFETVIEKAMRRLRPIAKDHHIRLTAILSPGIPEYFQGDPKRIERVIFNLVSNGLLYNETGEIFIRVKLLNQIKSNAFIEVTIRDKDSDTHEPEIVPDPSEAEKIFLKDSHEFNLRMSISRAIIELMGGKIWFHHKVGKGSTHFFTLHLQTITKPDSSNAITYKIAASELTTPLTEDSEPVSILVSDDSFIHQQIIKLLIRSFGHNFSNVKTGKPTIERLKDKNFEILLIDLTSRSGLETIRRIRATERVGKSVYIIGMTSQLHEEVQHCISEVGINDIISKPVNDDELALALKCAVSQLSDAPQVEEQPAIIDIADRFNVSDENERFNTSDQNESPLSDDEINALMSLTGGTVNKQEKEQKPTQTTKPHELAEQAIVQLKKNFIETTPQMIEQIKEGSLNEEAELIKSTALAIKASTAYIEAKELEDAVTEINILAGKSDFAKIRTRISLLQDAFLKAIERLQSND